METEAKYVVPDEATFNRIKEAPSIGNYVRKEPKIKKVHDRYLDTPEHLFYSRKYSVRLREEQNGGSSLLTIKRLGAPVEGAVHSREEYETQVDSPEISSWPEGEPKALAQEIAGERSLDDFVAVDQTRTVSLLYDGSRPVAEMSLDEILTRSVGEPVRAYELEVELLPDGTMDDLKAIGGRLEKEYRLAPQTLSKFERALLLSSKPVEQEEARPEEKETAGEETKKREKKKAAGILPTDSMETATRKLLAYFYEDILDNEDDTRKGDDPDALHDMRVATRRMRAALQIFEPYLEDETAGQLRRGLRSLTRGLGAVRDLDVLLESAESFGRQLPDEERADLQGLINEWNDRRKEARKKLRQLLDSRDYARLIQRLSAYTHESEESESRNDNTEPHQVRHVAASAIWERYETVRAFETIMQTPTTDQLHALRVKAKYLRYTLECFREVLPDGTNSLIKDIVEVQDHLGSLHDAVVAHDMARSYMERMERRTKKEKKGAARKSLPGVEKYLAERESAAQKLYNDFFVVWANITGRKWRSKLASSVATI